MWVLDSLSQTEVQSVFTQSSQLSQQAKALDETRIYLKVGEFNIGRKDSDINLVDKAVSRKHCRLTLVAATVEGEQPILSVTDLGATFGTFVNDAARLEKGVPCRLVVGDMVRFGAQAAAMRVSWAPLVFCVTRMGKKDKAHIRAAACELGARVVSEWGPSVTHMTTTKDLVFTVKTVLAIAKGVPIVSPAFADAILKRARLSDPLPSTLDFTLPSDHLPPDVVGGPDQVLKRGRHLKAFLVVSLVPGDEGEELVAAAGATLLRAYPQPTSSSPASNTGSSSSSSGGGGGGDGGGDPSTWMSEDEFKCALSALGSTSVPGPVQDSTTAPPHAERFLALRATLDHVVFLTPPLQPPPTPEPSSAAATAAGAAATAAGAVAVSRAAMLSQAGVAAINTSGVASAVVNLLPLESVEGVRVGEALVVVPFGGEVKEEEQGKADTPLFALNVKAEKEEEAEVVGGTAEATDQGSEDKNKTRKPLSSTTSTGIAPVSTSDNGSGGGGGATAKERGASGERVPTASRKPDGEANQLTPSPPEILPAAAAAAAQGKGGVAKGAPQDCTASSAGGAATPDPTPSTPQKSSALKTQKRGRGSPEEQGKEKESNKAATRKASEAALNDKTDELDRSAWSAHKSPRSPTPAKRDNCSAPREEEEEEEAEEDSDEGDCDVSRHEAPTTRVVRDTPGAQAGGWVTRGQGGGEAGGAASAKGVEGNGGDDGGDDGDDDDMSRYRAVVEEVSGLLVEAQKLEFSDQDQGGAHTKKRRRQRSTANGVTNFKRFKKNKVMYGPQASKFLRLVEVHADENERVEELRREELMAAEYERQAELLFADSNNQAAGGGRRGAGAAATGKSKAAASRSRAR